MEIAQKDSCLRARDHQNDKHQKQKAEHVVHLARPDRVQDEEQLNENTAEGQDPAHDDARNWLSVDRLVWYLTRDLIGSNWMLQGPLSESKIGADESQWN